MHNDAKPILLGASMLKSISLSVAAFLSVSATDVSAQNLIENPGFETPLRPRFGNNVLPSGGDPIPPWVLGGGNRANVVRVDSTNRQGNLRNQVIVDATNAPAGTDRHYLDILGTNDLFQSFTVPSCPSLAPGATVPYTLSGFFSTREGSSGTGSLSLREGNGTAGDTVAGSLLSVMLAGVSDPTNIANRGIDRWSQVSATVGLEPDETFSYVVQMDNGLNFDEASLVIDPTFNCAPLTEDDALLDQPFGAPITLNILNNDIEVDGTLDPNTVELIAPDGVAIMNPVFENGVLVGFDVPDQGTWRFDQSTGEITFTPIPGFVSDPAVPSYTVRDDDGAITPTPSTVTFTFVEPMPGIELIKTVSMVEDTNGNGIFGDANDVVNFDFTATNTGDTALAGVDVADTGLAGTVLTQPAGGFDGTLEAGEGPVLVATATYVLTPSDIENGSITNTATVDSVAVATDANGNPDAATPLVGVPPVSDTSDTGSDPAISQDDGNTPTVGIPADAGGANDPTLLTLPALVPGIELVKTVSSIDDTNGNGIFGDANDTVNFSFTASNTGDTALADVVVSDTSLPGLVLTQPVAGFDGDLAIDEVDVLVATAAYVITPTDAAAGEIENSATVSSQAVATDSAGNPDPGAPLPGFDPVADTSDTGSQSEVAEDGSLTGISVPADEGGPNDPTTLTLPTPMPSLSLVKSITSVTDVNNNGLIDANDIVMFDFAVTNTGNTSLANVVLTDAMLGLTDVPVTPTNLAPGEMAALLNQTFTIRDEDVAAGGIENTASIAGLPVATGPGNVPDPTVRLVDPDGNDLDAIEDDSDSGTQPDLDDTGAPIAVDGPDGPEGVETANLAGATDGDAANDPTVLSIAAPGITVVKSVANVFDSNDDGLFGGENDEVAFSFVVRNTGNVDLINVMIADSLADVSGGPIDLAAGATDTITFTATYDVTADDLERGFIENSATVSGEAVDENGNAINGPGGDPITVSDVSDAGTTGQQDDVDDPENNETPNGEGETDNDPTNDPTVQLLPGNPNPSLTVVKSVSDIVDVNESGIVDAGDRVTYSFVVTNSGNVRLNNVALTDDRAPVQGGPIFLEVGEVDTTTFTAEATITAAEAQTGIIENTAEANGDVVNSNGDPIRDPDTGEQLTAADTSDAGTEPSVDETGLPASISDPAAIGTGDADPTVLSILIPSIELRKSVLTVQDTNGDGLFGSEGDVIEYVFEVENTGNTTLTDVIVSDANATLSGGPLTLAPGATDTTSITGTHVVTADDVTNRAVENTAEVAGTPVDRDGNIARGLNGQPLVVEDTSDTGTNSDGDDIPNADMIESPDINGNTDGNTTNDPTVISIPTGARPNVSLVKSVENVEDADNDAVIGGVDDVVTYSFTVSNIGNTDLVDVVVSDPLLGGEIATIPFIEIGETQTVTAEYVIVAANEEDGFIENTAAVLGQSVNQNGDPFIDLETGQQLTAASNSDTGTARDGSSIDDPAGLETPNANGDTDGDPGNDPTIINIPLTPSDAAISGTVFLDNDRNGSFDSVIDTRLSGFDVILRDSDGNIVAQTVSDSQGEYLLAGFGVGQNYVLEFVDPTTGEIVGSIENLDFERDTVLSDQNQEVVRALPSTTLILTKTTPLSVVTVGQSVPYQIALSNPGGFAVQNVDIADRLPVGLIYTPGTSFVNGEAFEPDVAGQRLTWSGFEVPQGDDSIIITLTARVAGSAAPGDLTNTASTVDTFSGVALSNVATASVRLRPEAVFDCSDIIGKVFDDVNRNGYQDGPFIPDRAGITDQTFRGDKFGTVAPVDEIREPGLPHVRLITTRGLTITTDEYGRYHVPCAALPDEIGENFTLKVDVNSLPTGYRMTTENPRTMRVTAGILTEMNFGASIGRIVDIDLTASAFNSNHEPVAALANGLDGLLAQVARTPSTLRISYFVNGESNDVAQARLNAIEAMVREKWRRIGSYQLTIERTVTKLQ